MLRSPQTAKPNRGPNVARRTVTRTFRVRKEWDDVLQEEAEKKGLSVNVLMNKILRRYALFDRWAERYNAVNLIPQTLRGIVGTAPEERLAKAGEVSGSDILGLLAAMGLPQNYESFVYMIEELLGGSEFARWFSCFHHTQGDEEVFHLQHDLGHGWSTYVQAYCMSCLKSMNISNIETRVYDYAVSMKVKHGQSRP